MPLSEIRYLDAAEGFLQRMVILLALGLSASAPAPAQPSCAATLAALRAKVEANYAGFRLEVSGQRRQDYETTFERLTREAERAAADSCYFVLDRFTGWFADPHLFVFQNTRLDTAESARRARNVRTSAMTEDAARAYFRERGSRLNAIEGIWYDGSGLRVAVLPDSTASNRYIAIVVTSDSATWNVGAVRATFTETSRGTYAVVLSSRNFATRYLTGVIHKDVILRLSPGIWAKEYPVPPTMGLVDSRDPRRPTFVIRGNSVIVSLVSHDPSYAAVVDSLVRANDSTLRAANQLIVDLRGNEGGSSWITNPLLPFIRSRERRSHGYATDSSVMLSSPDQIAYARRAFGSDTSAFVRELIRRMQEAPGELVFIPQDGTRRADTAVAGRARVGVLADRGTVSAAEVLLLRAKESTRATVFGEASAGALDYQSTNVVRILPDEFRWLLGYPTITASRQLPRNGMRGRGITPDVPVPVSGLLEPILDVERRLVAQPR